MISVLSIARIGSRRLTAKSVPNLVHAATSQKFLSTTKFAKSHEYVQINGDIGTVGITNHAADALGDVVFVDLPSVGTSFEAGDTFGSVESVKAASDVYTPVSGEVIEINSDLESNPGVVNESPFEQGWFIKLKMNNAAELEDLMNEDDYKNQLD